MQVGQGGVFVDYVNNLGAEGLNKGALGPKEAVEEVSTCDHLTLRGQGSSDDT